MSKQNKLKSLFYGLQDSMIADLKSNKENETHPVQKGDFTEVCWLEMLRCYLPKRYQVEKAFVLDSKGNQSEQIDIVICDQQYSPFLFKKNKSIYVPAESVYAVLEVKQTLNKTYIEYAGKKTESVRKLHRTNAPIYHVEGKTEKPKDPFKILSGILTLDSSYKTLSSPALIKAFSSLNENQRVDMGCVLNMGSFLFNIDSSLKPYLVSYKKESALILFFLELLQSLQKLGTVPAIDISAYANSLNK